ncbi:nucleoside hydrolase [Streptomyces sp. BRA346]|uniref:nucleoside hydrolase n=1 Tax=Streptomyces sp. BRA346 TaxID=2878199 RepID=UPI0040648604
MPNVSVDPEAARAVFHAGFRLTAIGLDVATRPELDLGAAHLAALAASATPEAAFLLDVRAFVRDRGFFGDYCGLIDSLAVAAVLEPGRFDLVDLRVEVETRSEPALGQTIVDAREHFVWDHLPTIEVAADADFPRFLDRLVGTLS